MSLEDPNKRKIREQLLARRAQLLSRYRNALDRAEEELAVPAHELTDIASDQWDAQVLTVMSDADAHTLENVIAALQRLDAGTYGQCTACDQPIEPGRLSVLPEAAECVECARFAEDTPPRWTFSVGEGR
ncbi:MAG TPA: TraR/DksA family transcriptional regulator [Kofleriaceae bacterium]|nr:TraR/DksA family transcriptional regulator [Kofleriaceae bacterium]